MNKQVKTKDLFVCTTPYLKKLFDTCVYPWEMIPDIKTYILGLMADGLPEFTEIAEGVFVGENVKIHPTATLEGPTIIGAGTEIRTGAFIRGSVITGSNCVIGNATELKNCILLENVQVPHYNYVGDSILGNFAHLGAGAVCSNLKSSGTPVAIHAEKEYETGLRKVGAILADKADIGCGCVLNPGTVIGKDTTVYPLNALRGVFPSGYIVKSQNDVVKKKQGL